jgi:transcriptional regulator with XRE-family HTH domain
MVDFQEQLAKRLKVLRKERNLSQEELSKEAGYSRTYVSKIETGQISPTVDAIKKIADVLDVPVWKLFYFNEKNSE